MRVNKTCRLVFLFTNPATQVNSAVGTLSVGQGMNEGPTFTYWYVH